jgi:hypothetical protein
VEDRWRPKSDPRADDLDQYGRGEYDPATGLYEWYEDAPDILTGKAEVIAWPRIFEQWALVEADFHSSYGVDLSIAYRSVSWRWFAVRVLGLMADPSSRLARHFTDKG